MQHKAPRLGKGLSALIGSDLDLSKRQESPQSNDRLIELKLSGIVPNRYQPRQVFDDTTLGELVASVRRTGVMQPVIVRPVAGSVAFELVAGERRWRAAQMAGLSTIPALVRELSDQEAAEWAVVENVQREDLNAIDKGWAMRKMSERFGMSQEEIATRLSMDRSSVANLIRLTELEQEIADLVVAGKFGAGHAKALLGVPSGEHRIGLAKLAEREGWSVRQLEKQVRETALAASARLAPASDVDDAKRAVLIDLERQLGQFLGTKVAIRASRKGDRGTIEIEYYGLDHFDGLLRRMGFDRS